jgi:hypothetical protein
MSTHASSGSPGLADLRLLGPRTEEAGEVFVIALRVDDVGVLEDEQEQAGERSSRRRSCLRARNISSRRDRAGRSHSACDELLARYPGDGLAAVARVRPLRGRFAKIASPRTNLKKRRIKESATTTSAGVGSFFRIPEPTRPRRLAASTRSATSAAAAISVAPIGSPDSVFRPGFE